MCDWLECTVLLNASVSGSTPASEHRLSSWWYDALNVLITPVWLYQIYIKNMNRLFWKLSLFCLCSLRIHNTELRNVWFSGVGECYFDQITSIVPMETTTRSTCTTDYAIQMIAFHFDGCCFVNFKQNLSCSCSCRRDCSCLVKRYLRYIKSYIISTLQQPERTTQVYTYKSVLFCSKSESVLQATLPLRPPTQTKLHTSGLLFCCDSIFIGQM